MKNLINLLKTSRLTPNQLVALHSVSEGTWAGQYIPYPEKELALCEQLGFIEAEKLSDKGLELLHKVQSLLKGRTPKKKVSKYDTPEFHDMVLEFRSIFPAGKLPSGKVARTNVTELKKKLVDFFTENPQYDYDLVLDAADDYVSEYRKRNYDFMQTAGYFVSKEKRSELATWCDQLEEQGSTTKPTQSIYNVS